MQQLIQTVTQPTLDLFAQTHIKGIINIFYEMLKLFENENKYNQ